MFRNQTFNTTQLYINVSDGAKKNSTPINFTTKTPIFLYLEPYCGNTHCEAGESCSSCSQDCGACAGTPASSAVYAVGGGGGGTTTGPTEPRFSIIISKIEPGTPTQVNITKETIDMRLIEVTIKNAATNVNIVVKKLADRPATLPDPPSDYRAYVYQDVTHTNLQDIDIEKVKMKWEVNKSFLSQNNYQKEWVKLLRYSSGWKELPTRFLSETPDKYVYESDSPGLSTFVIAVAIPVTAAVPEGGVISQPGEETTTTLPGAEGEGAKPRGGPGIVVLFILVIVAGLGAYYHKDKIKAMAKPKT